MLLPQILFSVYRPLRNPIFNFLFTTRRGAGRIFPLSVLVFLFLIFLLHIFLLCIFVQMCSSFLIAKQGKFPDVSDEV